MTTNKLEELIDSKDIEGLEQRYKDFFNKPDTCRPLIIINSNNEIANWKEMVKSPKLMLDWELEKILKHLEVGDDHLPHVRVQFGTGIVASAFGCTVHYYDDNLPAIGDHVLNDIEEVKSLKKPNLNDGLLLQVNKFTEFFLNNIPWGIKIQHPDIQSPFNNAHLIRGDDIFLDFYDDPDALDLLLKKVTDFMIELVPNLRSSIGANHNWFYDWGGYWKGVARISNCSMQMIGSDFYQKHVMPCDNRFFQSVGGGRMHYCGRESVVIEDFLNNDYISALDFDSRFHNLWDLCEIAKKDVALFTNINLKSDYGEKLLNGEWPDKRNLLIVVEVDSVAEGRSVLQKLKDSIPY